MIYINGVAVNLPTKIKGDIMNVKQKDLLMDLFAKRAKEHSEYDDYYINLTDLENIVNEFCGQIEPPVKPACETNLEKMKEELKHDIYNYAYDGVNYYGLDYNRTCKKIDEFFEKLSKSV